jgi:hypothetical protein
LFKHSRNLILLLLVGILFLTSAASAQAQGQTPPSHKRFTTQLNPLSMEEKAVEANAKLTNLVTDPSFEALPPNPYWIENDNLFGTPLCYGQSDCGYFIEAHPTGSGRGLVAPYTRIIQPLGGLAFPACGSATCSSLKLLLVWRRGR